MQTEISPRAIETLMSDPMEVSPKQTQSQLQVNEPSINSIMREPIAAPQTEAEADQQ